MNFVRCEKKHKGVTLAVMTADTAAESTIYRKKPNPPDKSFDLLLF